jgi:hypothetical protein
MTNGKIIIRKSKNNFFKSKRYQIKVNDTEIRELNHENNKTEFLLPIGQYSIKIGNNDSFKTKNIFLAAGQTKVLTINPSLNHNLFAGLLMGITLVPILVSVVDFIVLKSVSLPFRIGFLSLLFFLLPKKNMDDFEITYSKL